MKPISFPEHPSLNDKKWKVLGLFEARFLIGIKADILILALLVLGDAYPPAWRATDFLSSETAGCVLLLLYGVRVVLLLRCSYMASWPTNARVTSARRHRTSAVGRLFFSRRIWAIAGGSKVVADGVSCSFAGECLHTRTSLAPAIGARSGRLYTMRLSPRIPISKVSGLWEARSTLYLTSYE